MIIILFYRRSLLVRLLHLGVAFVSFGFGFKCFSIEEKNLSLAVFCIVSARDIWCIFSSFNIGSIARESGQIALIFVLLSVNIFSLFKFGRLEYQERILFVHKDEQGKHSCRESKVSIDGVGDAQTRLG